MSRTKRTYIVVACLLAIGLAAGSFVLQGNALAQGGQNRGGCQMGSQGGGCAMGGGQGGCSMMGGNAGSDGKGCSMMGAGGKGCPMAAGGKGCSLASLASADPKTTRPITGTVASVAADGSGLILKTEDGPRLVLLCATPPAADGKPAYKVGDKVTLATALVAIPAASAAGAAKPAAAATYVCPMHPDVTSTKPGTCPKCGMDLVKKG